MGTVTNLHGVTVKRCCASFEHKGIEADGTRVCRKMLLKVKGNFCCGLWQMSYNLKKLRVKN
jgi:hypothetical protein